MLELIIPETEVFNEEVGFHTLKEVKIELEHSLASISKWESKFRKTFLSSVQKTREEVQAYIPMMTLTPNVPPSVFLRLTSENYQTIVDYISQKPTATKFFDDVTADKSATPVGEGEAKTSELIYYWMVVYNIPFEADQWNIERLFALIRICSIKNQPEKKTKPADLNRRYAELNKQRLEKYGTKG